MTEQKVLTFVATSFRSIWALEVVMLLRRERLKSWAMADIIRETRTSENAVAEALANSRVLDWSPKTAAFFATGL